MYNEQVGYSDKGKTENSVKAGRLCHLIPALIVGEGDGCNEKAYIESVYACNYIFDCTYAKSKIAPGQVRAIF